MTFFDMSDEATGLPPLDEVDHFNTLLPLMWHLGHEGLVSIKASDHEADMAVNYLSLRGYVPDEQGGFASGQIHIALPTESIVALHEALETLMSRLNLEVDTPEGSPED